MGMVVFVVLRMALETYRGCGFTAGKGLRKMSELPLLGTVTVNFLIVDVREMGIENIQVRR